MISRPFTVGPTFYYTVSKLPSDRLAGQPPELELNCVPGDHAHMVASIGFETSLSSRVETSSRGCKLYLLSSMR
jgi:hypothetical protein